MDEDLHARVCAWGTGAPGGKRLTREQLCAWIRARTDEGSSTESPSALARVLADDGRASQRARRRRVRLALLDVVQRLVAVRSEVDADGLVGGLSACEDIVESEQGRWAGTARAWMAAPDGDRVVAYAARRALQQIFLAQLAEDAEETVGARLADLVDAGEPETLAGEATLACVLHIMRAVRHGPPALAGKTGALYRVLLMCTAEPLVERWTARAATGRLVMKIVARLLSHARSQGDDEAADVALQLSAIFRATRGTALLDHVQAPSDDEAAAYGARIAACMGKIMRALADGDARVTFARFLLDRVTLDAPVVGTDRAAALWRQKTLLGLGALAAVEPATPSPALLHTDVETYVHAFADKDDDLVRFVHALLCVYETRGACVPHPLRVLDAFLGAVMYDPRLLFAFLVEQETDFLAYFAHLLRWAGPAPHEMLGGAARAALSSLLRGLRHKEAHETRFALSPLVRRLAAFLGE